MPKCKYSSKKLSTNASRMLSSTTTSAPEKSLAGSVLSQSVPKTTHITVSLDAIKKLTSKKKKSKKRAVKNKKMSIQKPSQPSLFDNLFNGVKLF